MSNLTAEQAVRWTSADLDLMPDNGIRYEIIDGELFMAKAPHWEHQRTCGNVYQALREWSETTGLGQASIGPGVLFGDFDNVIPDVVWVTSQRLGAILDAAGHLTGAPDLVVEVLSLGSDNQRRDREAKLRLYSLRGVREYWLVDWRQRDLTVYRRTEARLELVETLLADDTLKSPLLPGFTSLVARLLP